MTKTLMTPTFFPSPTELREWLEEHAAEAPELWVGFYKKGSGRPSITWSEAVDQALCFGWIDGVRKSLDDESYVIRFTPRRARSIWSAVNSKRALELIDLGLMHPAGQATFEARAEERSGVYSHEQRHEVTLGDDFEQQFRANEQGWGYFQALPASYRKAAIWWVVSAKREDTQRRRLATLIADSAEQRTIPALTRPTGKKGPG